MRTIRRWCLVMLPLLLMSPPVRAQEKKDTPKVETKAPVAKAPASQPVEPKDAKEAAGTIKDAISAAKAGRWWYFSALVIMVVMFALKLTKLLERMGRWKYVVVPVLSLAAALLAAFQGGVSIEGAVGVFSAAWATGMLEELVNHGILGKPRATP